MEKAASHGGTGFGFGVKQVRGYDDSLLCQEREEGAILLVTWKEPMFRAVVNSVADVTYTVGCSPGAALQLGGPHSPAAQSVACWGLTAETSQDASSDQGIGCIPLKPPPQGGPYPVSGCCVGTKFLPLPQFRRTQNDHPAPETCLHLSAASFSAGPCFPHIFKNVVCKSTSPQNPLLTKILLDVVPIVHENAKAGANREMWKGKLFCASVREPTFCASG